jgi:hypothetical protein
MHRQLGNTVATPELLFTLVTNKSKYITSLNGPPKTCIKTTSTFEHVLFRFLPLFVQY